MISSSFRYSFGTGASSSPQHPILLYGIRRCGEEDLQRISATSPLPLRARYFWLSHNRHFRLRNLRVGCIDGAVDRDDGSQDEDSNHRAWTPIVSEDILDRALHRPFFRKRRGILLSLRSGKSPLNVKHTLRRAYSPDCYGFGYPVVGY